MRAISRLWVTTSTVRPVPVWAWSSSRIWTPVRKSSSPVGSSASTTGFSVARARAMATRCCSPPDSSWGKWWRRSPSPTCSSTATAAPGDRARPVMSSANWTFSSAVRLGKRLKLWKTKLTQSRRNWKSRRRVVPDTRRPATMTSPDVATSSAPMMFRSVVFPLPEGPSTTTNSPSSISRSASARAVTVTAPTRYSLPTARSSTVAGTPARGPGWDGVDRATAPPARLIAAGEALGRRPPP